MLRATTLVGSSESIDFCVINNNIGRRQLGAFTGRGRLDGIAFIRVRPPRRITSLCTTTSMGIVPLRGKLVCTTLPDGATSYLVTKGPVMAYISSTSRFTGLIKECKVRGTKAGRPRGMGRIVLRLEGSDRAYSSSAL